MNAQGFPALPGTWTPQAAFARRRIAVIVNGKSRRGRDLFEAAVSGLQAAGFSIGAADPESRDVVIQLVRGRYAAALAGVWAASLAGWRPARSRVREIRARAFTIECTPQQPLSVDGETGTRTPVAFTVDPGALQVIVPRGSNAASRASV